MQIAFALAVLLGVLADEPPGLPFAFSNETQLESIPPDEADRIKDIVDLTLGQMKSRYEGAKPVLRGVHPKDHGCVQASFEVLPDLPEALRVGVFAQPGRKYDAWVRFSNAAVLVGPDSRSGRHGSRGMAIKLMGVEGQPLVETFGPLTQDFLMVNHPVFAFANVEDYQALSKILLEDKDDPSRFFKDRVRLTPDNKPDLGDPMTRRTLRSGLIASRIQSPSLTSSPPAFQKPPAIPTDNRYFSGAPYLFGAGKAMKYSARPVDPPSDAEPDVADPNYLRTALAKRLAGADARDIVFEFQVQVRSKDEVAGKLETEIEDACTEWDESKFPCATVARLTIRPQDFDSPERRRQCEDLSFTPWHGIGEHRPIGGINRLKLAVYRASSELRHNSKEPAGF